jgi:AraC family transcriptional regulator
MQIKPLRLSYQRRLQKVSEYLHAHLHEDLDLNRLAEVACMSAFHWHRIYQAYFGESVVATVKRLRLQRAARLLLKSEATINDVAQQVGFANLQSFTRMFADVYGLTPGRYRLQGRHSQFLNEVIKPEGNNMSFPIEIRTIAHIPYVSIPHTGPYMEINQAFDLLKVIAFERQLFQAETRWLGIYFDDPGCVSAEQLRSCACLSVPESHVHELAQAPLQGGQIAAGRYAVLRFKGPYSDMQVAYEWLFGVWLPASEYEADERPVFEEYLNNPRDTPPNELMTEIFLPVRD